MPSLAQFLESCRLVEKALSKGGADSADLQRCADELKSARWDEAELAEAAKALMTLRLKAESKSRFFRIRAHLAQTLIRASSGGPQAAAPRIDRVF